MLDIKMQLSTTPKEKPDQTKLGFGIITQTICS